MCVSVPPSWLEKPSNQEVTLGQKVELPCRADGAPLPKITWKKEIGKGNKILSMTSVLDVKELVHLAPLDSIIEGTAHTKDFLLSVIQGKGFTVACCQK
jgi:hypothetical protein